MSAGHKISKEEALLIISGWRDSSAVIDCSCEVAPLAVSFRGRIVDISGSKRIRFLHFDGKDEFVFDVKDDFDCWYVEPRDFPEDAKTSACALTFLFVARHGDATKPDFIALIEAI
jgi:hypothetical protein